jgi:hypothetical protein
MKQKALCVIAAMAAFAVCGCASQKAAGRTAAVSEAAEKTANNQKVLDWANRGLGEKASPEWLLPAIRGNWTVFKQDWQVSGDKVLKVGVSRAPRLNAAQTIADVQYAARLASQLKQSVLTKAAITLGSNDEFNVVQDAATKAVVTITGQERLCDFWQLIETVDSNGKKVSVYNYYVVYACDTEVWSQLVAKYLFEISGQVQDKKTQQTVAAMFKEIDAETKHEREKNAAEFAAEIRAQQQALQKPLSRTEQAAAYRSGDPVQAAAASVTKSDTDYIAALAALLEAGSE